ncbi:hypothetical protein NLX86_34130 [Streptomyces sp. A3M-1-3]|uniref:hypothetical protein n=1 Tax=Streptomyces sp. A3M-1-3 TaxID=2962044 RepID=UPI0020B75035|nr:hypothetical protein [Streptomyces sp. A3M-1-3]MCP3822931.1 hypothetical protein [Streptomyces sp. A3M-1-3]
MSEASRTTWTELRAGLEFTPAEESKITAERERLRALTDQTGPEPISAEFSAAVAAHAATITGTRHPLSSPQQAPFLLGTMVTPPRP